MELTDEWIIPREVDTAFVGITNREATKLLSCVGQKIVQREKLFLKHLRQGQATWPAPTEAYQRWKTRTYGPGEQFVASGDALQALTDPSSEYLKQWPNGELRTLKIGLRRIEHGVNVYKAAQLGRFGGVRMKDQDGNEFELNAEETFERNREMNRSYHALKRVGKVTGSLKAFAQRATAKTVARLSSSARPIVTVMDGDEQIVRPVMEEELNITMSKRGF